MIGGHGSEQRLRSLRPHEWCSSFLSPSNPPLTSQSDISPSPTQGFGFSLDINAPFLTSGRAHVNDSSVPNNQRLKLGEIACEAFLGSIVFEGVYTYRFSDRYSSDRNQLDII